MELSVGTIVNGKVTGITKFGAFVALEGGKSGLVHISEVANAFVSDVHDFLAEGQEVKVKILSVADGKISLSVKQAQEEKPAARPVRAPRPAAAAAPVAPPPTAEQSFEDKLKQFMTLSDSKMSELNRSRDGKRRRR